MSSKSDLEAILANCKNRRSDPVVLEYDSLKEADAVINLVRTIGGDYPAYDVRLMASGTWFVIILPADTEVLQSGTEHNS